MLKHCAKLLGLVSQEDKESQKKKEFGGAPLTLDMTLQSRDISVRIVHAGGREELYQDAVCASQLMEKYPGMCVARPEVFKNPHQSLLWPEENLFPGQKYYMIPSTTVQKLKHRQLKKVRVKGPDLADARITWDVSEENMDESIRSAKEFYVSGERQTGRVRRRSKRGKKPFVPPLPTTGMFQGLGWEPSLASVEELSP